MSVAAVLFYNAAILAATGYIVFWRGHSGWWFLLALLVMASISSDTKETRK